MQEDENIQRLLAAASLEFSLNNQFLLTVRNTAPVAEEVNETEQGEDVVEEPDTKGEEVVAATQD